MKAAFVLGRSLSRRRRRRSALFVERALSCDADRRADETLRVIDAQALADVLGTLGLNEGANAPHIAIDGKTMRASKDSDGKAEHVLSAFCGGLQTVLGHEASRGKGLEIPDALKLLERLDVKGKIVTGDAIFCQKSIVAKIVNAAATMSSGQGQSEDAARRTLKRLSTSRFFPLSRWDSGVEKAHGRIERRIIDVLPAEAAGIAGPVADGPANLPPQAVAADQEKRTVAGGASTSRLSDHQPVARCASPQAILQINRDHWGIEIMHRNKDVFLGEDGYTNRNDNAPANIFSLTGFVLAILKTVSASPTRAIEYFRTTKTVPSVSSQRFTKSPCVHVTVDLHSLANMLATTTAAPVCAAQSLLARPARMAWRCTRRHRASSPPS